MSDKPKYPNVRCAKHPDAAGYVICEHVLNEGMPVGRLVRPTEIAMGEILCGENVTHPMEIMWLICAYCANEKGWIPADWAPVPPPTPL